MKTFDDIESFRRTADAVAFAKAWIEERKTGTSPCDHLINLTIWSKSHPHQALGIVLNLVDQAQDDDLSEMIAMGPAVEIVESTDDTFSPCIQQALATYPKFALFTKYPRENSEDPRWTRLSKR